jgi:hypothetical protein
LRSEPQMTSTLRLLASAMMVPSCSDEEWAVYPSARHHFNQ